MDHQSRKIAGTNPVGSPGVGVWLFLLVGQIIYWLVDSDSTHLENLSQNGNLPQIRAKIENI